MAAGPSEKATVLPETATAPGNFPGVVQSSDLLPAAELKEKTLDSELETTVNRSSGDIGTAPTESGAKGNNDERTAIEKADSKAPKSAGNQEEKHDPYENLSENEAEIIKRQVETQDVVPNVRILYRYASRNDMFILIVSAVMAIAAGAALPLMTVIFGNLQGTFEDFFLKRIDYDGFMDEMTKLVVYFVYLGVGEFIATYIATVGFIYTGEHISDKIREHYLASCLRQNIGFFDQLGAGEVATRITADTNLIQDGISEKVSVTLSAVATFIAAFVIGFIHYWKLTLILLSTVIALMICMGGGSAFIVRYNKQSIDAYAQGGSLAEEVISSVRNAVAFGTQDRLAKQYDTHLVKAERFGFKVKCTIGVMVAGMMLILYLNYGLAFWMGSRYLLDGIIPLEDVLIIMMSVMIGAFNIGNVAPNVQAFTTAVSAAAKIYTTIDRESPLDPTDKNKGDKLDLVEGNIKLKNIKHIYPSRPEVVVMDDVTLEIPAGKTTALVGASGSGKSTIVGLAMRFYEPVAGKVYLDGHDISTLNLRWLRQHISLVSQEPVLFGTTIYHNIRYGLIGTKWENESEQIQRKMVEEAAAKANAHDFISSLPEGYKTHVGERGFLLSGGQKQRIAIARAIISDPKILLLDEATSALDTKSEGIVQAALETAAEGRTTITIAHRLSTIREAHNIVVMSQGRIIEQGTHNELLEMHGSYYNLVSAQNIAAANEMSTEEETAIDKEEEDLIRKESHKEGEGSIEDPDDDVQARLNRLTSQKSASSMAFANRKLDEQKKYSLWTLIKLITSFNKPEWKSMMVACICSAICGGGNPTQAIFFAKQITTMSVLITDENKDQIRKDTSFWSLMYLMLAWVMFIAFTAQGIIFARGSERLIHRVRNRAFRTMLRQDIEFFDRDENSAGALTSFLSTETTHVAGLSGVVAGTLLMMLATLIAAFALGLAIGWKLSLVCIATVPVLLGCGFFRFWMLAHFQRRSKKAYADSASYASEAISAVRTVASLTREHDVLKQYKDALAAQNRASTISVAKSSLLYAASQSLLFLVFALGFWYGGTLIGKGEYSMFQFFVCFMAVIFGAQSAGSIFSFAPDMGKAHHAAAELKALFDRQPRVDTWADEGEDVSEIGGSIEFRNVHFRYPTRPEQPVLRGLNLDIKPGQYVALVGASGCGKSTTISLLERFYDPLAGGIYIDGREISRLKVNEYREHIALVSQEPTLYQGTIRDNILLGIAQEVESVTDKQIEFACKEANIYNFIISLPDGFNTVVGSKGTLLSGGQKQRIAIARALIRDPKVLLLDEATSALDSESEHVVQAALDKAAKGRTTIAVAHRLSTIAKADIIYVFDQGRVVEQGTHNELMKKGGRYAELVNLQSLEKK